MKFFAIILLLIGIMTVFSFMVGPASAVHDQKTRGVDEPKIAVYDDNVYVVWKEGTGPDFFDLFFAKSIDGGNTFDEPVNLTNGDSFYPDPRIVVSENNVYVLWEDRTSPEGIDSIYFTKSNDGGESFDEPRVLDPVNDIENQIFRPMRMIESNGALYIFASYYDRNTKENVMLFMNSKDNGNTFSDPTTLFESGNWEEVDVAVDGKGVIYVLADDRMDYDEVGNLNLRKIFPDGTLGDIAKVNGGKTAVTNPELAISGNNVYSAWRSWEDDRWNLAFTKSHDGGETFDEPKTLNVDPSSKDIHGTEGSHIFAYGDSVYVHWQEVYWDGENQSFKIWTATSDNLGENFDVKVHLLNDLLHKYGLILTVQQDEYLYSMAVTTKNPPFDDDAIYLSSSKDVGKSFTRPIDVLEDPLPRFRYVDIATENNSIHFVAQGDHGSNCVLYTSSHDLGASFTEIKSLSSNGNPMDCLGIEVKIAPPRQQIESGTEIEDVKCMEDRSRGYILVLAERDGQPICVTAKSYDRLLEMGMISEESFETIALSAAKNYLLSHPDVSTVIVEDSLDLDVYMTRHSIPPAFIIKGSFESSSPIYGEDDDPLRHTVSITLVQNNKVHLAEIDDIHLLTKPQDSGRNSWNDTIVSPTIKTILSTDGQRADSKGLIALLITEVSKGGFDHTTRWTFQSIGYAAGNKGESWGFLPDKYEVHETVDEDGNDALDRTRMSGYGVFVPAILLGYPVICDGEQKIGGEAGAHHSVLTRNDTSMVYYRSTDKGLYPDENGIYDIQFVSMFKTEVDLPPNLDVIENKTVLCTMEEIRNDATHAYYTRVKFKIDDQWTASYYSPESKVKEVHEHATILVRILGDKFDFSGSEFHLQDPKINFEQTEPSLIHRHSNDAILGFLFETFGMHLSSECIVVPEGEEFCNDGDNSLKFYVNDEKEDDISKYLISEDDRILISYGPETEKEIAEQLEELESMAQYNYRTLDKLMKVDFGTVREGTYNHDLGFGTAKKLMEIDMKRSSERGELKNTLSQKRHEYNIFVKQYEDPQALKSLQNEIKRLESQLEGFGNNYEYTTEEIFQRVNEIEAENIKMYKIGLEEYEKYVAAKKTLENTIKKDYWNGKSAEEKMESFPIVRAEINPEEKAIEIILHKDVESNTTEIDRYESIIENVLPEDISWIVSFSDDVSEQ